MKYRINIIFMLFLLILPLVKSVITDDLIHVYNFEEASGNLTDQVNDDHLSPTNNVLYQQTGINNFAYEFNDRTDYFHGQTDKWTDFSGFTASLWVDADTCNYRWIYGEFTGAGLWGFATNNGNWATWIITSREEGGCGTGWHNIVQQFNETHQIFYIDGNLINTYAETETDSGIDLYVGTNPTSPGTDNYGGHIDELYFWNRTLTASEILELNSTFYPFLVNVAPTATWRNYTNFNGTSQSVNEINLFINFTDDSSNLVNFTIYDNSTSVINVTDFNITKEYIYNITNQDTYLLIVNVTDGESTSITPLLELIIDRIPPKPTWLNYTKYNSTLQSVGELNLFLNISSLITGADLVNFTIYDNSTPIINVTDFNITDEYIYNITEEKQHLLIINATNGEETNVSRLLDVVIDVTNGSVITVTNKDSPPFVFINESIEINTTCIDNNLFGCNINITLNGIQQFFDERINLTGASVVLSNITSFSVPGTYIITSKVSDDHTKNVIPDYAITRSPGKIIFNNDVTIQVISSEIKKNYPIAKKDIDRYNIDFNLTQGVHLYNISSKLGITYRKESDIKGHLVIGKGFENSYWIDMENTEDAIVELYEIKDNYIIFRTTATNFNSIGGVNVNISTRNLIVREKGDVLRMADIHFGDQTLTAKDVWVSLGITQFNVTREENAHLLGTWNVEKPSGVQPITGFWRIVIDGTPIANISNSIAASDNISMGLITQVDNVSIGLHNVSFEHRKEHSGGGVANPMFTNNVHWGAIQPKTNTTTISHIYQMDIGANIAGITFTPIINVTHSSNFASEIFVGATFQVTPTTISNTTLIIEMNGNSGCSGKTTHETASSIETIMINCIFNYSSSAINNISILGRIDAGTASVDSNIVVYTLGVNKTIANNFNSTIKQDTTVTVSSTTPVLIDSIPINISTINGTAFIMATATIGDTANLVNMMINIDDGINTTRTNLISGGIIENIAILHVIPDLSKGSHDVNLYGWGSLGTAINFINYSLSVFEGINVEGVEITTVPRINITFPINNSVISDTFITGTCEDIAGISSVISANTSWVFNDSSTTLFWRFDYILNISSNQTLNTSISCINPFGNTANQSIQWNVTVLPPSPPPPPPNFTFSVADLELDSVSLLLLFFIIGGAMLLYAELTFNIVLIMGSGIYLFFYGLLLVFVSVPFALLIMGVGLGIIARGVNLGMVLADAQS